MGYLYTPTILTGPSLRVCLMLMVGWINGPAEGAPLTRQEQVVIYEIMLIGNTVIDEAELASLTGSYINRSVTLGELQELREAITRLYVQLGYVNSGAVIPDQDISDGVLTIQMIEGRLYRINVNGHSRLNSTYFTEKLLSDRKVLNIADLQQKIRALHADPLIEKVDARLIPGTRPGEGVLDLNVVEARPYHLQLGFNNHRSPSIGEYRLELAGIHENFSGHADRIAVRFGYTQGLKDLALEYNRPLNVNNTRLTMGASGSESSIIEEPFDAVGIRSQTERYFIGLTQPFYASLSGYHNMTVTLEKNESQSYLLDDQPYNFSPGAIRGVARTHVIRLANEWLRKRETSVLALRSRFSFGLDIGDATIHGKDENGDDIPDGEFTAWLGQLQWLARLPWRDSQVIIDGSMHHAFDPLLSLEKFGLGGATTVRGYRENVLVRDNTLLLSLEHRLPVYGPRWQLVTFFDYGRGDNVNQDMPSRTLRSVGLGLRWQDIKGRYRGEIYWADPQDKIPTLDDDNSPQDNGVHFALDASF